MIYAIGDVHGEAEALRELLARIPVQPTDLVIFLGDVINRGGNDPFDCAEQVIAFDRCRKVFIQGNHEEAMLGFLELGDLQGLAGMNPQSTLDSYARHGYALQLGDLYSLPETHLRLYAQAETWTLPFYITDQYIFTHAGWDLAVPIHSQSTGALRWGKVKGWENPVWPQTIVRGHTPMAQVTFSREKPMISVDTGCGLGGLLSAVRLPDRAVFTARPHSFRLDWHARLYGPRGSR